jgi:hypothetical protein
MSTPGKCSRFGASSVGLGATANGFVLADGLSPYPLKFRINGANRQAGRPPRIEFRAMYSLLCWHQSFRELNHMSKKEENFITI